MTHQLDVARSREIVARWCTLAEQRLEYLTELFETGRWRRFHSEIAFLENIQEAKAAVEAWRNLSTREASRDNSAIDMSWLGRIAATLQSERFRDKLARPQPLPAKVPAEPPPTAISIVPKADPVSAAEAPSRGERPRDQVHRPQPPPEKVRAEPPPSVVAIVPKADPVRAAEVDASPRGDGLRDQAYRPQPPPAKIPAEPPSSVAPTIPKADLVRAAEAISPPADDDVPEPTPGPMTIVERYPLLRNAL